MTDDEIKQLAELVLLQAEIIEETAKSIAALKEWAARQYVPPELADLLSGHAARLTALSSRQSVLRMRLRRQLGLR